MAATTKRAAQIISSAGIAAGISLAVDGSTKLASAQQHIAALPWVLLGNVTLSPGSMSAGGNNANFAVLNSTVAAGAHLVSLSQPSAQGTFSASVQIAFGQIANGVNINSFLGSAPFKTLNPGDMVQATINGHQYAVKLVETFAGLYQSWAKFEWLQKPDAAFQIFNNMASAARGEFYLGIFVVSVSTTALILITYSGKISNMMHKVHTNISDKLNRLGSYMKRAAKEAGGVFDVLRTEAP